MRRRDFLQKVAVASPLGVLAVVSGQVPSEAASAPKKGTGVVGLFVSAETNPINGKEVILTIRYRNGRLANLRLTEKATYKIDGIKRDYVKFVRNPVAANPQGFNDTYADVYQIEFWGGATPKWVYFEPSQN